MVETIFSKKMYPYRLSIEINMVYKQILWKSCILYLKGDILDVKK
jgi:hypothetical protein